MFKKKKDKHYYVLFNQKTKKPLVEITPEMIEAGVKILLESGRTNTDTEVASDCLLVEELFCSMYRLRKQ